MIPETITMARMMCRVLDLTDPKARWLQALDMQVMGACRGDERLKPLLKINGMAEDRFLAHLRQHFEPAEIGMLARCFCVPLVSVRVGKIKKEGTLMRPTTVREKYGEYIRCIKSRACSCGDVFEQSQESVRKDVERAFGVLQARFAIIKNPALIWDKVKIGKIMRACIILHNMIVEDERTRHTQFDVSGFQQREGNSSFQVDLTYSTDMPTNLGNMMGIRNQIRDREIHKQLKADLVNHIWRKFGRSRD